MANEKLIFGLQQSQIEKIEYDLETWKAGGLANPKFNYFVWHRIATELHWEPLTLCLAYFKYLNSKNESNNP